MASAPRSLVDRLTGDAGIAAQFAAEAEIAAILVFEAELAEAQAGLGLVPAEAAARIAAVASGFGPDLSAIGRGMERDGVCVPSLVADLRQAVGEPHAGFVHVGATSQDAIDTGLMLRLRPVLECFDARLGRVLERLETTAREQGWRELMAQTRMHAALPFTVADKLESWVRPLAGHRARLGALRAGLPLQLGGPIGTGVGASPAALRAALARRLGLRDAPPWHSDRTAILDIAQGLALLAGTLGKIGQDIALMAQTGRDTVALAGGGGSSAMAHKKNPVGAEVLVSIGRFNAGLLGLLAQSLIHENERSGAAWTLEWMVLPQMAETTGRALVLAQDLLAGARFGKTDDT